MCVHACLCVCVSRACMRVGIQVNVVCPPLFLSSHLLMGLSLTQELIGRLGWLASTPREPPVSASPALGLKHILLLGMCMNNSVSYHGVAWVPMFIAFFTVPRKWNNVRQQKNGQRECGVCTQWTVIQMLGTMKWWNVQENGWNENVFYSKWGELTQMTKNRQTNQQKTRFLTHANLNFQCFKIRAYESIGKLWGR